MLRRHAVMYSAPLSNALRPKEIFFGLQRGACRYSKRRTKPCSSTKRPVKGLLYLARDCYSVRSATIGSTRAARVAGIQEARNAAVQSNDVAMVSMRGSHGETPKS